MKNYFTLERFFLLYDHYAFIDVPEYYADQLFIQHKVTVASVYKGIHIKTTKNGLPTY